MTQQENVHFLDYWRVLRSRKEVVVSILLLVVLAGVLITLFVMPRVYRAETRIAIEESNPDISPWQGAETVSVYNYMFLQTQFEIIQSRQILYEVIRQLNLERKFGEAYGYLGLPNATQQTLEILAGRVRVQQYRDTNLIEIQVALSRPKEEAHELCAVIANRIAAVFRAQREERNRERLVAALDALETEYREQERKVQELEGRLSEIRERFDLVGESGATARADTMDSYRVRLLITRWNDKVLEASSRRALAESVAKMSDEHLLNTSDFIAQNRQLMKLREEKDSVDVELQDLLKDLGEMHPRVQRARAVLAELETKLKAALDGLRSGVLLESEKSAAELATLEQELESARRREITGETTGRLEFSRVERELDQQRKIADVLRLRWRQERIDLQMPRTTVEVIDPAEPASVDAPVSPNLLLNVVLSVLIGLGCGVGMAFFMEYVDTSIRTVEDIERHIGTSVMGIVPQKVLPLLEEGPESPHAEAYRVLRTNIRFAKSMAQGKTLCVTSGSVGEGKSLTTANLAYVCAQLGERTLIIDGDLRRPRQHRILGVSNNHGLADVLRGESDLRDMIQPSAVPNLFFLPAGRVPTAAQGLLDSSRLREVIRRAREEYDFILLDSPPMMGVSDASVLVSEVDGTLLVIQYRKYPRSVSSRAKSLIENVGGNLLGVVLNNINISRDSYYYYYYHTYYSAYSRPGEKSSADDKDERAAGKGRKDA